MQTWVYKSNRKANTYLYVSREDDFSQVPDALTRLMGKLKFVLEVELDSKRKLAQADVAQVIQSLQDQGYFLQLPPGDEEVEKIC